jgi:arabinose-5-phosphate isomerase
VPAPGPAAFWGLRRVGASRARPRAPLREALERVPALAGGVDSRGGLPRIAKVAHSTPSRRGQSDSPQPDPELVRRRLERAAEVIRIETEAIARLGELLDQSFSQAVDLVLGCAGQVVVTGLGKAGLVGQKISATFASTGTPSIFLHPVEALHGDLGRVRAQDLVLALSNSGETSEVNATLGPARRIGAGVLAVTGAPASTLARLADCVLDIGRVREACPLELAPTASTTAMLALGDALAMAVLSERGFGRDDYARYHPAGALGRRLLRVHEVMRTGEELPLVPADATVAQALIVMSRTPGRPGAALLQAADGSLAGIFTDGDLRRLLETGAVSRLEQPVLRFAVAEPKSIGPQALLEEAERLLHAHRIDQLPVLDEQGRPVGLLDVQDVLDVRI